MALAPHDVTQLLKDWSGGDQAAADKLMPLVYEELRRLAHQNRNRKYVTDTAIEVKPPSDR